MSMPKLNAPVEIHWRRSNMNTRDPILMKSVEVLKDCRSLNVAAEMNFPMPRSVEKVPVRNEKRCSKCMDGMNQTETEYSRLARGPKSKFEPNRPSSIGGRTIYTFSHCESASVHLRSADCIGVVSWDTTPAKVASYRHSAPL